MIWAVIFPLFFPPYAKRGEEQTKLTFAMLSAPRSTRFEITLISDSQEIVAFREIPIRQLL